MKTIFNIYAFDGEGASTATGGTGSQAAAVTNGGGESPGANGLTNQPNEISFDDFIAAHKDDADKWFQERFNKRHGDYKDLKSRLKSTNGIMSILAEKYGLDSADIDGIGKALQNDNSLYEEAAMEAGMTTEQYREFKMLSAENKRLHAEQEAAERDRKVEQQMRIWDEQANNLKQLFPNFDLYKELENPVFAQALSGGLNIESAFYAVHGAEITNGAMQYTAQAVKQATVDDMVSRKRFPSEGALSGNAAAKVAKDISSMSKKEIAEMAEKSMRKPIRL